MMKKMSMIMLAGLLACEAPHRVLAQGPVGVSEQLSDEDIKAFEQELTAKFEQLSKKKAQEDLMLNISDEQVRQFEQDLMERLEKVRKEEAVRGKVVWSNKYVHDLFFGTYDAKSKKLIEERSALVSGGSTELDRGYFRRMLNGLEKHENNRVILGYQFAVKKYHPITDWYQDKWRGIMLNRQDLETLDRCAREASELQVTLVDIGAVCGICIRMLPTDEIVLLCDDIKDADQVLLRDQAGASGEGSFDQLAGCLAMCRSVVFGS